MNCDQAFDCLTDSHRRSSAELERHLAGCPRCRQMHDTLEPALDLFDGVVEEPDLSGLVRDSRPMVSTESRQFAEQTAARLVATGGSRQRRGNWPGFVRYAAIFLFGAGALLGLGAAQDLFREPGCTYRSRSLIRWGTDQSDAVVARCLECHLRSEPASIPAARRGTKGDWMQIGLGVPVRIETFVAVHRQRLPRGEMAVRNQTWRAFVCAIMGRSPPRDSVPAICAAPSHNGVVQVARALALVSDRNGAQFGSPREPGPHDRTAGLRRERDAARWS